MGVNRSRWFVYHLVVASCLFKTIMSNEDCHPEIGSSGNLESVQLIVETWTTRSSNFQWSDPERTSVNEYNIKKSSGIITVDDGAEVKFYGQELCIALIKTTEAEKADGSVDTSKACHKECINVGGRTQLDVYSGSGGRPTSTNPPCCFWSRRVQLKFFIPPSPTTSPPNYKCPQCTGCEDEKDEKDIKTVTCDAGDKCFTLKTQKNKGDEIVIIKDCSSKLRYWGDKLDCDYGCKNNVPLFKEYGNYRYSVCVSCCKGDECNLVESHVTHLQSNFLISLLIAFLSVMHSLW